MPKTRRRRRRSRRGGQWWKFWGKKTKSNPAPINMQGNAVMVEKPARPTSRFDAQEMPKPQQRDKNTDNRIFRAALMTSLKGDPKKTTMDARAGESARERALRKGVLGRKAKRDRRAANNTQGGKGRFRKRTRRRRRRRKRRRSRRRKSRRRRH